mmetsp:Transcript_29045/g.62575  ORF Transcript_29045/g.62575 Transcript_29045/m.62575 type:complete len:256 (-) Transcript_29045:115-882(-)
MISIRSNGNVGGTAPSFASQVKTIGPNTTQNTKQGNMKPPTKGAQKINSEVGATPSFASQVKKSGISIKQKKNASSTKPVIHAKKSDGRDSTAQSFASQVKANANANGLSSKKKPNVKEGNTKHLIKFAEKSDSKAGATQSFASQVKAKRLSDKQKTKASSTKPVVSTAHKTNEGSVRHLVKVVKKSDSEDGAVPSFASQAKAKGLSMKKNTNTPRTKPKMLRRVLPNSLRPKEKEIFRPSHRTERTLALSAINE